MNDLNIREKIAKLLSEPHRLEPGEVSDLQNILAERQRVGQFYASVPLLLTAIEDAISKRAKADSEKQMSFTQQKFTLTASAAPAVGLKIVPVDLKSAPAEAEKVAPRSNDDEDGIDAVLPLARELYENRYALNDVDQAYIEMLQWIYDTHGTLPLFVDMYVRAQHAALPQLIEAYQAKQQW